MTNVRRLLLPLAGVALGIASAPGCGDPTPSTPQAGVSVLLHPGAAGAQACNAGSGVASESSVVIGNPTGGPIVKDGDSYNGAAVGVACKVSGNDSNGYDVTAKAQTPSGSVTLSGHLPTTGGPITVTMVIKDYGSFTQPDCQATFATAPNGNGIAPGKLWTVVTCPHAIDSNHSPIYDCGIDGELRFENCGQ